MEIKKLITGPVEENCYLLIQNQEMLIVDPGEDAEKIKALIETTNAKPLAILLTHTHYDHIGALESIRNTYQIPVYVDAKEQEWLGNPDHNLSAKLAKPLICEPAEYEFAYRDYQIGTFQFKVVPTPGHSIGGVSFIFPNEEVVISGDALFAGSIGRTDLYTGNQTQLMDGIQKYLFTLPNQYQVFPGHRGETTIGYEKTTNPFFVR